MTGFLENKVVTVLKGGPGREREVSLRSAAAVVAALESLKAKVQEVDVRGEDFELPEELGIAFNLLHGTYGEDGGVQSKLDGMGVPYTGENAEVSRMAFDKILTKERFLEEGVPSVPFEVLGSRGQMPTFALPYVVKAPRQGSSVGVHIVKTEEDLQPALDDCFSLDDRVLVEKFFRGKELTVGILGGEVLPVVEIEPCGGFYDYQHKYTKGGSEYFVPARISAEETARVQDAALRAYRALGLSVYARIDVMLAADGELNVLEINTIPGMTETSLLPKAAAHAGLSFAGLCEKIVELSLGKQGR